MAARSHQNGHLGGTASRSKSARSPRGGVWRCAHRRRRASNARRLHTRGRPLALGDTGRSVIPHFPAGDAHERARPPPATAPVLHLHLSPVSCPGTGPAPTRGHPRSRISPLTARDGRLTAGAARALLGLEDAAYAVAIAERAAGEQWSVRQVEDAVRERRDTAERKVTKRTPKERSAQIIALEERLAETLGTTVKIDYSKRGGGKMFIKFGSVDDLERIYLRLLET